MFLMELFDGERDQSSSDRFSNDQEDQSSLKLSDLRKTRLTFAQIKKLRNMHDAKNYEKEIEVSELKDVYGQAPEGEEDLAF